MQQTDARAHVTVPWRAWGEEPEATALAFPSGWQTELLQMTGWLETDRPDFEGLKSAVRRVAAPGHLVSIAVEDLTRPSKLEPVLSAVVAGLVDADVSEANIDLVVAVGAHGRPSSEEIRRKVGAPIADRFVVRVHDPSADLAETGLTVGKTPLRIDARFLAADLRIGVGSIIPNPFAGFSGGAKIVLPGLASMDVLEWLHKVGMMGFGGGVAELKGNRIRAEIDRVGAELPLHFSVGCLADANRDVRELHYGESVEAHARGCKRARAVYATPMTGTYDLLFCNAYPKDGEFLQTENAYSPLRTGGLSFLSDAGAIVLMASCHLGRGQHGLFDDGMVLHRTPAAAKGYLRKRQVYVFSPGIAEDDCRVTHWDGYPFFRDWDALIDTLLDRHDPGLRAGIFPTASSQLGPPNPE